MTRTVSMLAQATLAVLVATPLAGAEDRRSPQGPPGGIPGTVTLPLAEYDRLVDRAARPPKRPEPPPIPAILARSEIHLKVVGDAVRGTLGLDGEVFRTGPTRVPLLAGATLLDARLAGRSLPLVSDGGVHAAVVTGPGPFSITLDWGARLTAEPGRASFVLPVPAAGSVRATLEVPGEQADVRLEPGLVTRRTASNGRTVVEATLDPGSRARFSWTAREGGPTPALREARFLSDVKTLVSVGEADLRLVALVDVSVVQGEPERFVLRYPAGFEVTGVSGSTLEKTEEGQGVLALVVREPARNRHQFLVTLERSSAVGSFEEEVRFPSVDGAQRETGEAAFEGIGTMELAAAERDDVHRMDVREASGSLKSLARQPLLAAFRYHRKAGDLPHVGLEVKRFPDAAVLAAMAERAVVTTLVTTEGRTLTEVALTIRNHAQPFLRVSLPEGATLFSAEVAGEAVKPVKGDDGTRVPLLRPGFRPTGSYAVSFVYLNAGTPFGKKGEAALALPRFDVPVSLVEWELFLPDRFKVSRFDGNALPAELAGVPVAYAGRLHASDGIYAANGAEAGAGVVAGRVTDESGAALPGVTIVVSGPAGPRTAATDGDGYYAVTGVAAGDVRVEAQLSGFAPKRRDFRLPEGAAASGADFEMKVAGVTETVTVAAETPLVSTMKMGTGITLAGGDVPASSGGDRHRANNEPQQQAPSSNVFALQRRVSGVLPVRVDIPRAGASYRFVRPLVLDEETTVSFRYKAR